jgi:hypothetical protein
MLFPLFRRPRRRLPPVVFCASVLFCAPLLVLGFGWAFLAFGWAFLGFCFWGRPLATTAGAPGAGANEITICMPDGIEKPFSSIALTAAVTTFLEGGRLKVAAPSTFLVFRAVALPARAASCLSRRGVALAITTLVLPLVAACFLALAAAVFRTCFETSFSTCIAEGLLSCRTPRFLSMAALRFARLLATLRSVLETALLIFLGAGFGSASLRRFAMS